MNQERAEILKASFFQNFNSAEFLSELDEAIDCAPKVIAQSATAFRHNLNSVIEVISLPLTLAIASTERTHFDRLFIAERIERIPVNEIIAEVSGQIVDDTKKKAAEDNREKEAWQSAKRKIEELASSLDGILHLAKDSFKFLYEVLHSHQLRSAAAELLRQGVVLTWGTLEVLVRDVFVTLLNENPSFVTDLMQNEKTRRRFESKSIPLDQLAQRGFNISTAMGEIIAENHDIGDLPLIKDVFRVLVPSPAILHDLLNANELWRLNQQRHLIVHRRGIVDQVYLDKTGDRIQRGSELLIHPDELKSHLRLVRDVGKHLILETKRLGKGARSQNGA